MRHFSNKKFFLQAACVAACLLVLACSKRGSDVGGNDKPAPGAPFSVTFTVEDGLLDRSGVVSSPKVSFTLSSEDKAGNYVLNYSVDGGPSKTVSFLYDGMPPRNLSSAFSSFSEYGKHTLRGTVTDTEDERNSVSVEQDVWMRYVPVTGTVLRYVCPSRDGEAGEAGVQLYEGEAGFFDLSFEPRTTFLHVDAASTDASVVSLGDVVYEEGVVRIPFSALKQGKATLSIDTENGPEKGNRKVSVEVVEDTEGRAVSLEMSLEGDLVFGALPLRFVVDGASGDASRRFRVDYLVDGVVVATDESVALNGVVRKSVSGAGLGIGEHVASVKVTALDGRGLPLEREQAFTVVDPMLSITGWAYNGVPVGSGSSLTLDVGNTYVVSLAGVPEAFAGRFVFGTSGDGFSVSGNAPWSVSPTSYGRGSFTLRYTCGNDSVDVLSAGVLRRDTCELLLEWKHAKGLEGGQMKVRTCNLTVSVTGKYASSMSVPLSGSLSYYGVCEYPVASKVIKDNSFYNTKETKTISGGTRDWSASAGGAGSVALDLLQQATAIETSYISAGYWTMDTIREGYVVYDSELSPYHAYLAEGQFYYELVVSSVSVRLVAQPQEGLSYRLKVSGIDRSKVSASSPLEMVKVK